MGCRKFGCVQVSASRGDRNFQTAILGFKTKNGCGNEVL